MRVDERRDDVASFDSASFSRVLALVARFGEGSAVWKSSSCALRFGIARVERTQDQMYGTFDANASVTHILEGVTCGHCHIPPFCVSWDSLGKLVHLRFSMANTYGERAA